MHRLRTLSTLTLCAALFCAAIATTHATVGCNAIGWDEPHGVTGCELYYPAIHWIYGEDIASGDGDTGTYHPERFINRAEFTKITLLASGITAVQRCTEAPFPDVPKDAWFAQYVCAAKERGIISGFPDGTFKPDQFVNYANGAKILAKTFNIPIDYDDAQFDETQNIWFRPYTMALLNRGATPETIDAFDQSLTRGEMAEMLYRLKTGQSSITKQQPPKGSESYPDDSGMGYEMHKIEEGIGGLYLNNEPDPPFVFTAEKRRLYGPRNSTMLLEGFRFSHVLQHERCGASGLYEHCSPTFADWAVGIYTTFTAPKTIEGLFLGDDRFTRYFGGKDATCSRLGIEGEYTEICIVHWSGKKTLVVTYDYIDTTVAYADLPGITPTFFADAMYARIRRAMQFAE